MVRDSDAGRTLRHHAVLPFPLRQARRRDNVFRQFVARFGLLVQSDRIQNQVQVLQVVIAVLYIRDGSEHGDNAHVVHTSRLGRVLVYLYILLYFWKHAVMRTIVHDVSFTVQAQKMPSIQQLTIARGSSALWINLLKIYIF